MGKAKRYMESSERKVALLLAPLFVGFSIFGLWNFSRFLLD
jgi:hypothetical protein